MHIKKIWCLLASVLFSIVGYGADYGILIDGISYKAGTLNPNPSDVSFTEYYVLNVYINQGSYVQLYNNERKEAWVVDLDEYSVNGFSKGEDKYTCTISGCYDFYLKLKYANDQLYIGAASHCEGGVSGNDSTSSDSTNKWSSATPTYCQDIMLQCFYWDSYQDKGYGDTKWATLKGQMETIATYFDMVWLPPSAQSQGGTGYHPCKFSNQNCDWGSEQELKTLISICHANNTRVIADVVLNHHWNVSSWCDFYSEDFGIFGQFQLTKSHICSDDEVWTNATGECTEGVRGAADTGEKYGAARDLDHTSSYVQQFSKAYLHFLLHTIGYDGFRWDVAKGFSPSFFGNYIADAKPYFSVGEYFDDSYDALRNWVEGTGKRSTVFDFACKKYSFGEAFIDGVAPDLSKLIYEGQPRGLIGAEYRRYAVTFIDNHDTFERPDNQGGEFLGYHKSMTEANKTNLLMANAFLLAMPGIPCVFYPHWAKYAEEIKKMIIARKSAGVHNMSEVTINELATDKLIATIKGTKGKMILKLGSGAACNITPVGYKKIVSGNQYAMFVEDTVSEYEPQPALSISFSPKGGVFSSTQTVTIRTNDPNAIIYYTTDGSLPTTSSSVYSQPIQITTNSTIKAFATINNGMSVIDSCHFFFVSPNDSFTVAVTRPKQWNGINLYAWMNDNEEVLGKWPGKSLQPNDSGLYTHTFAPVERPVNIIWNDGTNQTQDIKDVSQTTCYSIVQNVASILEHCFYTKNATDDPPINEDTIHYNDSTTLDYHPLIRHEGIQSDKPIYTIIGTRTNHSYQGIVIQDKKKYLLNP